MTAVERQRAEAIVARNIDKWGWGPLADIEGLSEYQLAVDAAEAGYREGLARQSVGVEEMRERWKGECYLDLAEERNPGTDEFAKGYNGGLAKARDMIFARLPALLSRITAEG